MLVNKQINFELLEGIILIEAEADEKKGFFVFDTGSTMTVINNRYILSNGCKIDVSTYSDGVQSPNAAKGAISRLALAGITIEKHSVCFLDLSYVENSLRTLKDDLSLLGTIGMDIINRYQVRMDYENKCIVLNPSEPFRKSYFVDFELDDSMMILDGSIGSGTYRFLLDTGANTCLINNDLCACEKVQESGQSLKPYLVKELSFGRQTYYDIAAVNADISKIKKLSIDAIIGFQILSRQRVDFNFTEKKIYFEQY